MAKIGTAHIEIKPVLNEDELEAICQRIEDAVTKGISRGLASQPRQIVNKVEMRPGTFEDLARAQAVAAGISPDDRI
jgi:hypothetical protein